MLLISPTIVSIDQLHTILVVVPNVSAHFNHTIAIEYVSVKIDLSAIIAK